MSKLAHTRLYAILDSAFVEEERMLDVCRQLVVGGADIIQLRAKDIPIQKSIRILDTLLPLFENAPCTLVINDHAQVAAEFPEVGLHVGQDDMPVEQAREIIGEKRLLGLSTHSLTQARDAIEKHKLLDYFAIGPIYTTQTKTDNQPVGLGLIRDVAALNPPLPFFCIGGITRERTAEVISAGGLRVVCISDLLNAPDILAATREMKTLLSVKK